MQEQIQIILWFAITLTVIGHNANWRLWRVLQLNQKMLTSQKRDFAFHRIKSGKNRIIWYNTGPSNIQEKKPNHLMTRSLFYIKQAQEEKGEMAHGCACCLAGWKKRPSHPTLFAKFLPKKMCTECDVGYNKAFYNGPHQWIRILLGKWFGSGIRIADMSPIKKKMMNCSCFKDLNFLTEGGL